MCALRNDQGSKHYGSYVIYLLYNFFARCIFFSFSFVGYQDAAAAFFSYLHGRNDSHKPPDRLQFRCVFVVVGFLFILPRA